MKMRAEKGAGALAIEEFDGFTTGLVALAGRPLLDAQHFGVGGLLDRLDRPLRPRQRLRRSAAPLPARRGVRHGRAHAPRAGLPRAGRGHQRRPLRHPRRAPALRRAHLRAPSHHRGRRRPPAGAQRRALSQAARGDGAALLGSSRRAQRDRGARRASRVHDGRSRLPLPGLSGAGRRQRDVVPAPHRRGRRPRSLPALSREGAPPDRPRARSDREARSRRLLPDRVGHRQLLPPARHPGAGPRLGRQQRRLLQPRHHRHRPDQDGAALRAVPVGRARRVARHRPRPAERRSPRAGHPARLPEVRPARRGHDRQRHHLPRQERRARGGEGARARRGADRSPGQGDAQLRVHRPQRDARPQHGGGRHRAGRAARADVRRTVAADPGPAAPSRAALGRDGGVPGRARFRGAAGAGEHARPRRHPVGQGRLRRHGHREGRSARPRHDGGAAGRHRARQHVVGKRDGGRRRR